MNEWLLKIKIKFIGNLPHNDMDQANSFPVTLLICQ